MNLLKFLSLALLLLAAPAYAESDLVDPPSIAISPDVYYPFEEILYLEGSAGSGATVELRLQKTGARPVVYRVKAQPNGEWALAEKVPLSAGEWEARARTTDGIVNSEWSNPRIFRVVISGLTVAGIRVKYITLAGLIFLFLLAAGSLTIFFSLRIGKLRRALVAKEVGEAKETLRSGLAELRHEIFDELKLLNSSRRLSADKLARKEHLMQELERIEHQIEREIGEIGSK